jgi:hypothetical protein
MASVDPYLDVGMELAEEADETIAVISDDEENPIAAEFRMAFQDLPEAEGEAPAPSPSPEAELQLPESGKLVDQFMDAFSELPDASAPPSRIKPSRGVRKLCCKSGHALQQGTYFDRSCDVCARTATSYRCSGACEYDLCNKCYDAAASEARSVASPQQSCSSSTTPSIRPSKKNIEALAASASCPELSFARRYLAQRG